MGVPGNSRLGLHRLAAVSIFIAVQCLGEGRRAETGHERRFIGKIISTAPVRPIGYRVIKRDAAKEAENPGKPVTVVKSLASSPAFALFRSFPASASIFADVGALGNLRGNACACRLLLLGGSLITMKLSQR